MHRRPLMSVWQNAALGVLVCIAVISSPAQVQLRPVHIILQAPADPEKTIAKLRSLGFQVERRMSAYEWLGHLPQERIPAAARLPGVYMIVLQPDTPKQTSPAHYHVRFRVKLAADSREPTQRWIHYQELVKHLQQVGFEQEPLKPQEWRYNDILRGKLPARAVSTLLKIMHIRSVLLIPSGWNVPFDNQEPVLVEIWLANGFNYDQQQAIRRSARERLEKLGFTEAIAHDTEFGMRLIGWLPANQIVALLDPSHDLEKLDYAELPLLRAPNYVPLFRLIEVMSQPGKMQPPKINLATPGWPEMVTPDLKLSPKIVAMIGQAVQDPRVELIFRDVKSASELFDRVRAVSEAAELEGSSGPILWLRVPITDIPKLAGLPEISSIRLPQPPLHTNLGTPGQLRFRYIRLSQTQPVHDSLMPLIRYQEPLRIAIVATDFRGWEQSRGRTLPAKTYLLDYTRWFTPGLEPAPAPSVPGAGLLVAEEVSRLASVQELYLVRVQETAPYQVAEILQRLQEVPEMPILMRRRLDELSRMGQGLSQEERQLRLRKQQLLFNFRLDDPAYWKERDEFLQLEKNWQARKKHYSELLYRATEFLDLEKHLEQVNNVIIVPYWRDGYPSLPDLRPGLRWLPELRSKHISYIQVIPEPGEGEWWGWWRDRDNNGVMEFRNLELPRYVEFMPEEWTRRRANTLPRWHAAELNWLGWHAWPREAKAEPENSAPARIASPVLPPQVTIQLVVQWREVHEPRWANATEDLYRKPLTSVLVEVLQPLPEGNADLPQDLYTIVASSQELPERLENHPRYAIYELRLQFRTSQVPSRYAVRLRGRPPTSTMPAGVSQGQSEGQEIWLRLSAEVLEEAWRQQGRVVWLTPGEARLSSHSGGSAAKGSYLQH